VVTDLVWSKLIAQGANVDEAVFGLDRWQSVNIEGQQPNAFGSAEGLLRVQSGG
jgi:hypothetical protein